jgi:hypothetical protein
MSASSAVLTGGGTPETNVAGYRLPGRGLERWGRSRAMGILTALPTGPCVTPTRPVRRSGLTEPDIDLLLRDRLSTDGVPELARFGNRHRPVWDRLNGGAPSRTRHPWGVLRRGSAPQSVGQALRVLPAFFAGLGLVVTPVATGDGVGVRRLEIQVFVEGGAVFVAASLGELPMSFLP